MRMSMSLMFCLSPWNTFDDMAYVIDIANHYNIDIRIGIYGTMAFFDTTSELLTASDFVKQIPQSIHNTQENYDFVALYDEWRNGNLRLRCQSIMSCLVVHSNGDVPLWGISMSNRWTKSSTTHRPVRHSATTPVTAMSVGLTSTASTTSSLCAT